MNSQQLTQVLGALLAVLFGLTLLSYLMLSISKDDSSHKSKRPGIITAVLSLNIGTLLIAGWSLFSLQNWRVLWSGSDPIGALTVLHLICGVALVTSGLLLIRGHARGPDVYLGSNILFLLGVLWSMSTLGTSGITPSIIGLNTVLMIVSVYSVALIYAWEHFVFHFDLPALQNDEADFTLIKKEKEPHARIAA